MFYILLGGSLSRQISNNSLGLCKAMSYEMLFQGAFVGFVGTPPPFFLHFFSRFFIKTCQGGTYKTYKRSADTFGLIKYWNNGRPPVVIATSLSQPSSVSCSNADWTLCLFKPFHPLR